VLSDTDTACVAIAFVLCVINEKNRRWVQEWYKRRAQYTRANLKEDLMLTDPGDYKIPFFVPLDAPSFDGILRIAVTTTVPKEMLTCEKHSLTFNVYQLRHAIWSLEIILTIRNS
jgi:hypothetical protein